MDVKIVKLISGEELLTQIEEVDDTVVLKDPMMLIMQQNGLQMMPWLTLMFAEIEMSRVTLSKEHVMFSYVPKTELANGYRQQVGSVVTAPANAIDKQGKLVL